MKSYRTNEASERAIEALGLSEILVFSSEDIQKMCASIPLWDVFERKYFERVVKEKIEFQRTLTKSTKKEALEAFIQAYPESFKYAPRQHIASFLGMTPYTLSRIKL